MRLRDKVIVVTGGTTAIGRRIVESMLFEGARVVCAARSEGDMARIRDVGGARSVYHQVDVRDRSSVDELMRFAADHFGGIDVLVCNAGISNDGLIATMHPEDWRAVVETNLIGTMHCAQAALPHLRASTGRIVNVSSALSSRVAVGASAYSCSKAGIDMFTKACAAEFAEYGIGVNAVAPGFIDEGMGSRLADNDLVWSEYQGRLLAGRLGRGAEIAAAVVFLAESASSYVNGHILEVNGGLLWS